MAKNMVETEKPRNLVEAVLQAAKKAAEALSENKKRAPLPPKPETVFVAKSKFPSKTNSAESKPSPQHDEQKGGPVIPREKLDGFKVAVGPELAPEVVVQRAAEVNPEFAAALGGKPVKDEALQKVLAHGAIHGETLEQIARAVKEKLHKPNTFTTPEAYLFINRVGKITKNSDLFVHISGGAGWTFFDATSPGSASSKNVNDALQEIQDALLNDPTLENDTKFLGDEARDLAKSGFPPGEIRSYIQKLRAQQQITIADAQLRHREEQPFSEFHLEPDEQERMVLSPEWEIEEKLRRIEEATVLFPEGPAAEAATRRLSLMNAYFQNKRYERDVVEYMDGKGMTGGDRDKFYDDRVGRFKELSDKVNIRTSIHRVYGMIRGVGDPEKIWSSLLTVGERGFEHLLNENGGLNEIVFNKYVRLYKLARFDDSGNLRRLHPEDIRKVRLDAMEEMKRDKALYSDQYKKVYGRDFTDKDCEAIVRQAEFAVVISQQDIVAMLGGLGPGESDAYSGFLSTNTGEQILAAMDINRWFFEKWTNLSAGQRMMWENACRLAGESSGRMEVVMEKLQGATPGSPRFLELAQEAFGKEKNLETYLKCDQNGKENKKVPTTFQEITLQQLQDRMLVAEGEKIVGELLEVYDHFSSGWRIGEHLKQIDRIYGYGDKLALGMRLRKEGYSMIHAVDEKTRHKHALETQKILKVVAQYRPQAIFEFLSDEKDPAVQQWMTDLANRGALTAPVLGEAIQPGRIDQYYYYTSKHFLNINELLAEEGLPPIDYSSIGTISIGQHHVIESVCGQYTQGYLSLMQESASFAGQPINIEGLTKEKYDKVYYRTRWLDDARLNRLERPKQALRTEYGSGGADYDVPLSELLTEKGAGNVDPLVRSWRDASTAVKAVQEVYGILHADKKNFLDRIVKIKDAVDTYSGKVASFRAALYLMGGWGKTAKTDQVYDWLFLGNLQNSSAMKRLFGDKAASMGLNELEEFMDEHDFALSKMKLVVPDLHAYVEKFLGITFSADEYTPEIIRRLPLYAYRSRLFIAVAAVIMTLEATKIADQTFTGSNSGQSH